MNVYRVILALVLVLAGLAPMTTASAANNCSALAQNYDKFQCCDAGAASRRCAAIENAYRSSACGELQCVVPPESPEVANFAVAATPDGQVTATWTSVNEIEAVVLSYVLRRQAPNGSIVDAESVLTLLGNNQAYSLFDFPEDPGTYQYSLVAARLIQNVVVAGPVSVSVP